MSTQYTSSTQPSSRDLVWYGLKRLETTVLLQIIGAVLAVIASIALFATLPFYGAASPQIVHLGRAQSVAAGLAWFIIAVLFIAFTSFIYFMPSLSYFTMWKPGEFTESSRLLRLGFLIGSIILLVALLVTAIINAINTPDIIKGYSTREALAKGLIWPIILGLIGSIVFFVGWIGSFLFLNKLKELFNAPALSKLGIVILVYGIVFVILKASLLVAYYGYTVAESWIVFALQPVLGLALLMAILGVVAWTLIYTEVLSLEKKLLSGTLQL
jgi:MFS family permease